MEKTYKPNNIEKYWYKFWEDNNYLSCRTDSKPYCIMIPPPNVTGHLHMGHAFQYTIIDFLVRYHRMKGYDTLWQMGTDHAGIATQMLVERKLLKDDIKRHDLGRDKFIDKVWEWKKYSGNAISKQMRRMGVSVNWSSERFTMDEGFSKAVQKAFITLYKEGLIYRSCKLVNWDPVLQTAISDLEVISQEEQGSLWHINYPIIDSEDNLIVATTRPETMLGDVAVAVHPEDKRYLKFIGKKIKLPLVDREIPIIADEHVEPEFGTGCVKITPAHDFNDYAIAKRHKLEQINIFTKDAKINTNAPEKYQDLDRFVARDKIVSDLKKLGYIDKIEPYIVKIPRCDRSGAIIEPMLTLQWFMSMQKLAKEGIDVVEQGQIEFVPNRWKNTYFNWLNNIEDWCISRQLWWGHRIPVWYDNNENIYVGFSEDEVRKEYNLIDDVSLLQDEDVLDTWFSSSLWTFVTLGWPEDTDKLKKYHPTSVLVTGFDIIFFWVARMIMMSLKLCKQIPFKKVYVHGLVRDGEGQKMSKSKGNTLDPLDLIDGIELDELVEKRTSNLMQPQYANKVTKLTKKQFPDGIPAFGTDALRFTFAALASTGKDINLDTDRIKASKHFCNKIWNASRFVLLNVEQLEIDFKQYLTHYNDSDLNQWIYHKLYLLIESTEKTIANYRFDLAASYIYEFIWNEYCDWYVEFSKAILYNKNINKKQKALTIISLLKVLEITLRLLHPFMPFITEEIWQKVAVLVNTRDKDSVSLVGFPKIEDKFFNKESFLAVEFLKQLISGLRNIRGEMNISPAKLVTVYVEGTCKKNLDCLHKFELLFKNLAKISVLEYVGNNHKKDIVTTSVVVEQLTLHVPLAGLVDINLELQRLDKAISKFTKELDGINSKLENKNFMQKAPRELKERYQLKRLELLDLLGKNKLYQDKIKELLQ